jgi:SAM-dependent methyltransferase
MPRVLPQHQSALTLLGELFLVQPAIDYVDWLDLACGRGQILTHLEDSLPDGNMRSRIRYSGYDINNEYARETERLANNLGFRSARVTIGQLDHFTIHIPASTNFSFVTFINSVHELPPVLFGKLLLELILRMKPDAKLFIYDMETLSPPELGANPWESLHVRQLFAFIYKELGSNAAVPIVQKWTHSSCAGWSVTVHRNQLGLDQDAFAEKLPKLLSKTTEFITELFARRLESTIEALDELSKYGGGETEEEQKRKTCLLYDYWSLSRLGQQNS